MNRPRDPRRSSVLDSQMALTPNDVHRAVKGQLQLSMSILSGRLNVRVHQAQTLCSRWRQTCNPFVQVLLCPDETRSSFSNSQIVCNTNNPAFDHLSVYQLKPEDRKKRLTILVWHQDFEKRCSEFLGCMSFGVQHLVSRAKRKPIEGWYWLLPDDVGYRKHLAVASSRKTKTHDKTESSIDSIMESMETIVLKRAPAGFGFTVRKGRCPVQVGRVKPQSTAQEVGLQHGQSIIRINGRLVTSCSAEQVVKIIRDSGNVLVLDVAKSTAKSVAMATSHDDGFPVMPDGESDQDGLDENNPPNPLVCHTCPSKTKKSTVHSTPQSCSARLKETAPSTVEDCEKLSVRTNNEALIENSTNSRSNEQLLEKMGTGYKLFREYLEMNSSLEMKCSRTDIELPRNHLETSGYLSKDSTKSTNSLTQDQQVTPRQEILSYYEHPKENLQNTHLQNDKSAEKSNMETENSADCASEVRWDPDVSCISKTRSSRSLRHGGFGKRLNSKIDFSQSFNSASFEESLSRSSCAALKCYNIPSLINDAILESPRQTSFPPDEAFSECKELLHNGQEIRNSRHDAVLELIHEEEEFIWMMSSLIQKYSRPLRHSLLTPEQHRVLFQNVEKLVALSNLHVNQLQTTSSKHRDNYDENEAASGLIGGIYTQRLHIVVEAYESYCQGMEQAYHLLSQLLQLPSFRDIFQKLNSSGEHYELCDFIYRPFQHYKDMLATLQRILYDTPAVHPDYHNLQEAVTALSISQRQLCSDSGDLSTTDLSASTSCLRYDSLNDISYQVSPQTSLTTLSQ